MTTIYLAEDQEMLNTALKTILNLEDNFEVIGSSLTGAAALQEILQLAPDVAILDIEMPDMTGLEIAAQLRILKRPVKIVILTTFAKESYFQQALSSEVNAYLLKDSPSEVLIQSVNRVLAGDTIFSPELVRSVLKAEKNPLTKREMEILKVIQTGANTAQIAQQVFLSEGTVRNYISSILSKTATKSRIEAINVAMANGWLG
ncbi:response regulator transcription factor [Enterococcus sp. HY326]|uniref:response regulator transcription factor n=1 Tax=Enterococcus sp. HY326 TaxID=2971265 RepID=UPI00223EDCAA|nr:response regulator transcription factor [Enterococcus sp. HY326]